MTNFLLLSKLINSTIFWKVGGSCPHLGKTKFMSIFWKILGVVPCSDGTIKNQPKLTWVLATAYGPTGKVLSFDWHATGSIPGAGSHGYQPKSISQRFETRGFTRVHVDKIIGIKIMDIQKNEALQKLLCEKSTILSNEILDHL